MNAEYWALGVLSGGLLLGALFFGGLWWTLRYLPTSRHPAWLLSCSLYLRLAVLGSGLYWLADGQWQRYALALLGVLLARVVCLKICKFRGST